MIAMNTLEASVILAAVCVGASGIWFAIYTMMGTRKLMREQTIDTDYLNRKLGGSWMWETNYEIFYDLNDMKREVVTHYSQVWERDETWMYIDGAKTKLIRRH